MLNFLELRINYFSFSTHRNIASIERERQNSFTSLLVASSSVFRFGAQRRKFSCFKIQFKTSSLCKFCEYINILLCLQWVLFLFSFHLLYHRLWSDEKKIKNIQIQYRLIELCITSWNEWLSSSSSYFFWFHWKYIE